MAPVHFVVLEQSRTGEARSTGGELDAGQKAFLANDLALDSDQTVSSYCWMHIPIVEMSDRKDLYKMLESRPNILCIAGHWHTLENRFAGKEDGWNGHTAASRPGWRGCLRRVVGRTP